MKLVYRMLVGSFQNSGYISSKMTCAGKVESNRASMSSGVCWSIPSGVRLASSARVGRDAAEVGS